MEKSLACSLSLTKLTTVQVKKQNPPNKQHIHRARERNFLFYYFSANKHCAHAESQVCVCEHSQENSRIEVEKKLENAFAVAQTK
jgi:hypothetical protein